MADCYYNGEFARHMPGALHSRGDRRSCQGRKRPRIGIVLALVKWQGRKLPQLYLRLVSPGHRTGPQEQCARAEQCAWAS